MSPTTSRWLAAPEPDEIADDHDPGRDAHAHVERRAGGCLEFRRGFDDRESGPHGPFGVVLVRTWIAEIGEHAVAHIFAEPEPPARMP